MAENYWGMVFRGLIFSIAIDLAIAAAIPIMFSNDGGTLESTIILFFAILFAGMLFALRNFIAKSARFYWFGKGDVKQAVIQILREANLPPPGEYDSRNFHYLLELADNNEHSPADRVKAAIIHTKLTAQWEKLGLFIASAATIVADDALKTWADQAPKKRPTADTRR
ncbi:MAG: hypothetical protein ACOYO0_01255 [Sandarakinorhabdus sp.]